MRQLLQAVAQRLLERGAARHAEVHPLRRLVQRPAPVGFVDHPVVQRLHQPHRRVGADGDRGAAQQDGHREVDLRAPLERGHRPAEQVHPPLFERRERLATRQGDELHREPRHLEFGAHGLGDAVAHGDRIAGRLARRLVVGDRARIVVVADREAPRLANLVERAGRSRGTGHHEHTEDRGEDRLGKKKCVFHGQAPAVAWTPPDAVRGAGAFAADWRAARKP